ncbi:hypothetical protein Q5752_001266 [Cryptotrichosporon argae]
MSDANGADSPRASLDAAPGADLAPAERVAVLEAELERTRAEKEAMGNQYRGLLGKLTAMRQSLGEKLKEDAEELDRREATINTLTAEIAVLHETVSTLRRELQLSSGEAAALAAQLAALRAQSDSSSSDVLSLTREMRELRGEMERLRVEREEWESEAGRERGRREAAEDEGRAWERRGREAEDDMARAQERAAREKERADNLQEVLSEFQAAKDAELAQATHELEAQLKLAVTQLSEFKLRAANAETRLDEAGRETGRAERLERELRDKNAAISKLRHDAVVTNEHLTEALRRLRKNSSDNNVDRRLVTNVLLSFLSTARADTKRFEMLGLLSTILGWDDGERERAGLQKETRRPRVRRKSSATADKAKDEAAMNESFSNLFVEFLLKEAGQGQARSPAQTPTSPLRSLPSSHSISTLGTAAGTGTGTAPSSPSPGATPPARPAGRGRTFSSSSNASQSSAGTSEARGALGLGLGLGTIGRKQSWGLQEAMRDGK